MIVNQLLSPRPRVAKEAAPLPLADAVLAVLAALLALVLADPTADATWLLILLARLLALGTPDLDEAVTTAEDTSLRILLAKLLPFGTLVADAPLLFVESQVGKHEEVTEARLDDRSDEKLLSQLEAAAPVSVVVTPLLTSTTD